MRFDVVTLLPEMFLALNHGLIGQALEKQRWELRLINPRQFTTDVHHTVDDRPYGGGDGMILLAEPLLKAVQSVQDDLETHQKSKGPVVFLSAHGEPISTRLSEELAREPQMTLVCGRYGGVDQRFLNSAVDLEVSVGDSIVTGGELPAMMLMDSIIRLLPGVLGNAESPKAESFFNGLLEAPQYTRPRDIAGQGVPAALLSGHHAQIETWRRQIAILRTEALRPDLLNSISADELKQAHAFKQMLSSEERFVLGLSAKGERA